MESGEVGVALGESPGTEGRTKGDGVEGVGG